MWIWDCYGKLKHCSVDCRHCCGCALFYIPTVGREQASEWGTLYYSTHVSVKEFAWSWPWDVCLFETLSPLPPPLPTVWEQLANSTFMNVGANCLMTEAGLVLLRFQWYLCKSAMIIRVFRSTPNPTKYLGLNECTVHVICPVFVLMKGTLT